MGALDDLLAAWRTNPDAEATIALCSFLGAAGREDLVREVGSNAETWHSRDVDVMVAVGRMYLDAGFLPEAQTALVAAGKAGAHDARPFRYLGEVLLRRGDAVRSEKVLARSIALGTSDTDVRHWHDRASFYIALQKRVGAQAVAEEVVRALPRRISIPAPAVAPQPFGGDRRPAPAAQPLPRVPSNPLPRFASEDREEISQVESIPEPPTRQRPQRAQTIIGVAPPKVSGPIATTPATVRRAPQVVMPSAKASAAFAEPVRQSDSDFDDEAVTTITVTPLEIHAQQPSPEPPPAIRIPRRPPPPPKSSFPPPAPMVVAPARSQAPTVLPDTMPAPPPSGPLSPQLPFASSDAAPTAFMPMPSPPASPRVGLDSGADSLAPTRRYEDKNPSPAIVLEHLSRVGIFEPRGGAKPAWEAAPKHKQRGVWLLSVIIVLAVGGGVGGYAFARDVKEKKVARAAQLSGEVDKLLRSGSVSDLRATDAKLSEAFELDSLSPYAARLWLRNRVMRALLLTDEPRGIDSAVHRAKTVGLTDKEVAFGRVASFLVEGDVAGAAALLPRWDKDAGRDAYYQLTAGAVLERAGDLRAVERYEAARTLAPDVDATEILLARLALLEFGKQRGMPVVESLRRRNGERPTTRALAALAWVVDPRRSAELPAEARLQPQELAQLPAPLRSIPSMADAVRAITAGNADDAVRAIDAGIDMSDTPALAVTLGFLAIELGNEQLARKAALRALSFAAMYPRARILAARVALLGGRLDEAQKAVEQLEPTSADVAVVRAAVAYEALEPGELDAALAALGEVAAEPAFSALRAASGLLKGTSYPTPEELQAMAEPSVAWGELVAADAALDLGELGRAEQVLGTRTGAELRPVHALRAARLKRLQGKLEQALAASQKALEANMTPALLIERSYELIAAARAGEARTLIASHSSVLGPFTGWLQALTEVGPKQAAQAKAQVAGLELPPETSPVTLRLLVARALVATGDKRAAPYVKALAAQVPKHPELAALAATK